MQNRNIDERLQILNDYIQRTIDALNVTRSLAQGLAVNPPVPGMGQTAVPGLQHTGIAYGVPQYVQTPQGVVQVLPAMVPQYSPFVQQQIPGLGYGLQHTAFGQGQLGGMWPMNVAQWPQAQWPQAQWPQAQWPQAQWPQAINPFGVPQYAQFGFPQGGGFSHTPFQGQVLGSIPFGYVAYGVPQFGLGQVGGFGLTGQVPQAGVNVPIGQNVGQNLGQTTL